MDKNKSFKTLIIVLAATVLGALIIFTKLILGGNENNWICVNGQWVKHGSPSTSKPQPGCGENNNQKIVK